MAEKKIGVIGVGNTLRRDDGIGINLINHLKNEKDELSDFIKLIDAGIAGMNLLHMIEPFETIIFIDAVNFDGKTGDLKTFSPEEVITLKKQGKENLTTHQTDLLKIIEIFKKLNRDVDKKIYIIGIQPADTSYGRNFSTGLDKKFSEITDNVIEEINKLSK
ncbi:MAG: hydrogenase maturation protease [Candidatus Thermoplasmatota archaeon]